MILSSPGSDREHLWREKHRPPRKAVLIFGYEYEGWPMEPAIGAFETLARQGVRLGPRHEEQLEGLVHPVHQKGGVAGWELLEAD